MLRSRKIVCAVSRCLALICVCLVLRGEPTPSPVGILCDPESGHCSVGTSESAPVQPVFQLAQLRGRRSVSTDEFWKRSYPNWARRFRSGSRAWFSPDDDLARYFRASTKDKGDAFWKRADPQGFWRRAASEADDEEDTRKGDEGHRNVEEDTRIEAGKRPDRLTKDDSPLLSEERIVGFPSKQRRRQEALTRPEFNPTGW